MTSSKESVNAFLSSQPSSEGCGLFLFILLTGIQFGDIMSKNIILRKNGGIFHVIGVYGQIQEAYQLMRDLEKTVSVRSWEKAYSYRIRKFFEEYLSQEEHRERSLTAITENEVNNFLKSLPYKHNEKVNYYRALKLFFDFTAKKGKTQAFYIRVNKLVQERVKIEYITEEHIRRIIQFIGGVDSQENTLENRLILALFLYTGLGRKYLADLTYDQISDDMTSFRLKNVDYEIPVKSELIDLLIAYKVMYKVKRNQKLFDIGESAVTHRVKSVSKIACGKPYSPTQFSNTFIKKALGEQNQWGNIYAVSQLTAESLSTITKHIDVRPSWIFAEQQKILAMWK